MNEENLKFIAWYNEGKGSIKLGKFDTLKEAQSCIANNEKYKKTLFTKKGKATSKNENVKENFAIYDNMGYGWTIRDK